MELMKAVEYPWMQKTDLCEARIALSDKDSVEDHAVVLAIDRHFITERIDAIREYVFGLIPEGLSLAPDGDLSAMLGRIASDLISIEKMRGLTDLADDLLTTCVRSWDLAHTAEMFGIAGPVPSAPSQVKEIEARRALFDSLPLPVYNRLLRGVIGLAGNF